jgi:hypothetical protein
MRLTVRRVVEAAALYPDRNELKAEYPELTDEVESSFLGKPLCFVESRVRGEVQVVDSSRRCAVPRREAARGFEVFLCGEFVPVLPFRFQDAERLVEAKWSRVFRGLVIEVMAHYLRARLVGENFDESRCVKEACSTYAHFRSAVWLSGRLHRQVHAEAIH